MISIIIPAKNKARQVPALIAALNNQTFDKSKFEVIILNDSSTDNTEELIYTYAQNTNLKIHLKTIMRAETDFKAGAIRNIGASLATGRILLFLDADVIPEPNLIAEHVKIYERNNYQPLSVVGYVFKLPQAYQKQADNFVLIDLFSMFTNLPLFPDIRESTYLYMKADKLGLENTPAPWRSYHSNNVSIEKRYFEECGCFEEKFVGWGDEDLELGYRIWKKGWPIILNRNAIGVHYDHETNIKQQRNSIFSNKQFFLKKHHELEAELYNDEYGDPKCVEAYIAEINNLTKKEEKIKFNLSDHDLTNLKNNVSKTIILGLADKSFGKLLGRFSCALHASGAIADNHLNLCGVFIPFNDNYFDRSLCFDYINKLNNYLFLRIIMDMIRTSETTILFFSDLNQLQKRIINSFELYCNIHVSNKNGYQRIELIKKDLLGLPEFEFCANHIQINQQQLKFLVKLIVDCLKTSRISINSSLGKTADILKSKTILSKYVGSLLFFVRQANYENCHHKTGIHFNSEPTGKYVKNIVLSDYISNENTIVNEKISQINLFSKSNLAQHELRTYWQANKTIHCLVFPNHTQKFIKKNLIFSHYINRQWQLLFHQRKIIKQLSPSINIKIRKLYINLQPSWLIAIRKQIFNHLKA